MEYSLLIPRRKNFIAYVKNDKHESHENVKFFDTHKFLSIIRECVMKCMFARWWWTFNIFLRSKINRKIPSSFNADSSAMSKANTPVVRVYLQDLHKISGFRDFRRLYNLQMWLENGFGGARSPEPTCLRQTIYMYTPSFELSLIVTPRNQIK